MSHKTMIRYISLFLLILLGIGSNAQNDTLYLETSHLLLKGVRLNKRNTKGEKNGEWIEYGIDLITVRNNSEFICASGDDFHSYTETIEKFRTLKDGEYNGIIINIESSIDTIDGVLYHDGVYEKILNRVPNDLYYIEARGFYRNNIKEGEWNYYHKSGNLLKSITYSNGMPIEDFKIYRNDGSVMISLSKIDNNNWLVIKYLDDGQKLETLRGLIKNFSMLY